MELISPWKVCSRPPLLFFSVFSGSGSNNPSWHISRGSSFCSAAAAGRAVVFGYTSQSPRDSVARPPPPPRPLMLIQNAAADIIFPKLWLRRRRLRVRGHYQKPLFASQP